MFIETNVFISSVPKRSILVLFLFKIRPLYVVADLVKRILKIDNCFVRDYNSAIVCILYGIIVYKLVLINPP